MRRFADTRKSFSQEAAGGGMTEALVDVRNCDFSNLNLSGKVQWVADSTHPRCCGLLRGPLRGCSKSLQTHTRRRSMPLPTPGV